MSACIVFPSDINIIEGVKSNNVFGKLILYDPTK